MGNINSIPLVSQAKSLAQEIGGDPAGALATQKDFAYNNTFPIVSQIASLGYAIEGENGKALDLQKKFAKDMDRVIDSIPVAGHIKGTVHFALGQKERGEEAMKAASHSTGVVVGGIGGFAVGGPAGAVAGGIAGGAGMDGIITASEMLVHKNSTSKPYGYFNIANNIAHGKIKTVGDGFDAAMVPVLDGASGLVAGGAGGMEASSAFEKVGVEDVKIAPGEVETVINGGKPKAEPSLIDILVPSKNKLVLDKVARDNRANQLNPNHVASGPGRSAGHVDLDKVARDNRAKQLNPNHVPSGPGRPAGYRGSKTKADLDNHAKQLNPNHSAYERSRVGNHRNDQPMSNDIIPMSNDIMSNDIPR